MVQSEGNMSLKNPVTPPGIDPGTIRVVAQCLNHYVTPDRRDKTINRFSCFANKPKNVQNFISMPPHVFVVTIKVAALHTSIMGLVKGSRILHSA